MGCFLFSLILDLIKQTEMAATLGFPFTAAQWMELERQAMIYKYMVASVPIPYELLLPIIQNLPSCKFISLHLQLFILVCYVDME